MVDGLNNNYFGYEKRFSDSMGSIGEGLIEKETVLLLKKRLVSSNNNKSDFKLRDFEKALDSENIPVFIRSHLEGARDFTIRNTAYDKEFEGYDNISTAEEDKAFFKENGYFINISELENYDGSPKQVFVTSVDLDNRWQVKNEHTQELSCLSDISNIIRLKDLLNKIIESENTKITPEYREENIDVHSEYLSSRLSVIFNEADIIIRNNDLSFGTKSESSNLQLETQLIALHQEVQVLNDFADKIYDGIQMSLSSNGLGELLDIDYDLEKTNRKIAKDFAHQVRKRLVQN